MGVVFVFVNSLDSVRLACLGAQVPSVGTRHGEQRMHNPTELHSVHESTDHAIIVVRLMPNPSVG